MINTPPTPQYNNIQIASITTQDHVYPSPSSSPKGNSSSPKGKSLRHQVIAQHDLIRRMSIQHRAYVRKYKQLLRDRDEEIVRTVKYCREIVDRALDVNHKVVSVRATFRRNTINNASKTGSPEFSSSLSPPPRSRGVSFELDRAADDSSSSVISIILLLGLCARLLSSLFVFSWYFVKDRIRNLLVDRPFLSRVLFFISVLVETISLVIALFWMWCVSGFLTFLFRRTTTAKNR